MIENPPRSGVELSPRLRSIATLAVDQFEEPAPLSSRFSPRARRAFLIVLILSVGLAARFGIELWKVHLGGPATPPGVDFIRAQARRSEMLAIQNRKLATESSSNAARAQFLQQANSYERAASSLQAQALAEEVRASK